MDEQKSIETTKISITLPTAAYFMSGIRDFTMGLIKNTTSFGEQWAFRFQSIVDELCNNAIEFGSNEGDDITILFTYEPEKYIEISVEDSGKNGTKAEDLRKLVEERSKPGYQPEGIRGRGLAMIVKAWSDELNFEDTEKGGIKVIVRKNLGQEVAKEESNEDLEIKPQTEINTMNIN
ncbi:MAG: ATP-binding protein [Patescibacteria group bacterium]|nr:ATP-binding protein [Patescibacteria group bacterium]